MKYKIIKCPSGMYVGKYKKIFWHYLKEFIGEAFTGFAQIEIFKTEGDVMQALIKRVKLERKMKERFKIKDIIVKEGEL